MRILRFLAVLVAFSLPAVGSRAAEFSENFRLAQGSAATYEFTFSDAFSGSAQIASDGYTIRYTPWLPPYFIDYYRELVFAGCRPDTSCSESSYAVGGYIKIIQAPTAAGFTVYAENRILNFLECSGVRVFAPCGASYGDAFVSVMGTSSGAYAVRTTAMSVPEPSAWLLMIAGFGLVGSGLRLAREVSVSRL